MPRGHRNAAGPTDAANTLRARAGVAAPAACTAAAGAARVAATALPCRAPKVEVAVAPGTALDGVLLDG